tara:strand:- start:197617 stop:197991 length:375 start_codon:yes stop_codon:yes gene_type:complete
MTNKTQNSVGPQLKAMRIQHRITLTAFAAQIGVDAGNYSRMERGVFAPPGREKLLEILEQLKTDSDTSESILDQAEIERGRLPTDLQDDEVLMKELPLLFRAIRRGNRETIDAFIEAVRKSGSA